MSENTNEGAKVTVTTVDGGDMGVGWYFGLSAACLFSALGAFGWTHWWEGVVYLGASVMWLACAGRRIQRNRRRSGAK